MILQKRLGERIAGTAKRGTLCPHRGLRPLVAAYRRPARRAASPLAAWLCHVSRGA